MEGARGCRSQHRVEQVVATRPLILTQVFNIHLLDIRQLRLIEEAREKVESIFESYYYRRQAPQLDRLPPVPNLVLRWAGFL